jgi:dolichol-phosphate mannosyltransferase
MTGVVWRFGKFNVVGLMGALWQVVLLWVLATHSHIPRLAATPIAVEIVVLHNFLWHERFTWRGRATPGIRRMWIRMWRFQAGNGLTSLVGNTVLMYLLADAPIVPSAISAIVICSMVNFLVADRWVYAESRERRDGSLG